MSEQLVAHHLDTYNGSSDCATTALAALLPIPLEPETVESLHGNTYQMIDLTKMAALEFHRLGIGLGIMPMPNDATPSRFLGRLAHRLRHGIKAGDFCGAFMFTKGRDGQKHVISVTGFHEMKDGRKKISVANTDPQGQNRFILKVEGTEWLDRNIHPNDGTYDVRMAALIGFNAPMTYSEGEDPYPAYVEMSFMMAELSYRDELLKRKQQISDQRF